MSVPEAVYIASWGAEQPELVFFSHESIKSALQRPNGNYSAFTRFDQALRRHVDTVTLLLPCQERCKFD